MHEALHDAHMHFFSHGFFKALLGQRPGAQGRPPASDEEVRAAVQGLGLEAPPTNPGELARRWIAELDRFGVSRAAIMASAPGDWGSVAAAADLYPERFAAFLMVDPRRPDTPVILDRALEGGLLKAVCLFPAMFRHRVYDPEARAVIDRVRGKGVVVFCHFGLLSIPLREKLGVPSRFDGTCAVPTDLHRVASDYPDVAFQVPHFGAGYLRETLFLGQQCPNVYVDSSSSNGWTKTAVPPLTLRQVFELALACFGPRRILWGSDSGVFPRGWREDVYREQRGIVEELVREPADRAAIFGGNAARLWGH